MIRWVLYASVAATGIAFAAGCYVGWKTSMKVVDSVGKRVKKARDEDVH